MPASVEYENFADAVFLAYKKNTFLIYLGQGLPDQKDTRWIARFWMDASFGKTFAKNLAQTIEKYEKAYGEIEKEESK